MRHRLLLAIALLAACKGGETRTQIIQPAPLAVVASVTPAPGLDGVDTGAAVTATFTRPLDCTTVTAASFALATGAGPVAGAVSCAGATATFTPAAALDPGTTHAATLSPSVKDASGAALGALYAWSFATAAGAPPPPAAPPELILSVSPAAGVDGVPATATVTATFTQPLDCATVDASSFTLATGAGAVAGAVTCAGSTATFTPAAALAAATIHSAAVAPTVKSLAGATLGTAWSWAFTTAAAAPPAAIPPQLVLSTSPAAGVAGVPATAAVTATFTQPLDCATVTAASFTLATGAGAVAGAVTCAGSTATFTPAAALAAATIHSAALAPTVKSLAGATLGTVWSWGFTTAAPAAPPPDTVPPTVLSSSPAKGALVSAAAAASVLVTFSEPIDCARLPWDAIALYEAGLPVAGYANCAGATLEFVPLPALPTQTSLLAAVSPLVRDLAGNPLGTAFTWNFDVLPWTRQFGGHIAEGYAVAVDTSGNIVLAGTFSSIFMGWGSVGLQDGFLVSLAASGTVRWMRTFGSIAGDWAASVAVDTAGNILIAGSTTGGLDGNLHVGASDVIVAKFDPAGVKLWTRQLGSPFNDYGRGVATDTAGNAYVVGSTDGGLDGNLSAGVPDLFLVKYNAAGVKQWTRQMGVAASATNGNSVAVDAAGNAYVTGSSTGGLDGNVGAGGADIVLVKFDAAGAKQWTRQLGSAANDYGLGVAIDTVGNVYVAGYTQGGLDGNALTGSADLVLVRYDATGAKKWTRQLGTIAAQTFGVAVAIDAGGSAYVTGFTGGGLDGLPSAGNLDAILVRYDGTGVKQWTRQLGTAAADQGRAVGIGEGAVYVGGTTGGGLDGNVPAGLSDAFVVKYDADGRKR